MAPEQFHTMEANRLRALARRVADYQEAAKLSTEALVKKLPTIGSSKTYKRILDGDLAELDLERQLSNFEAAVAWIESTGNESAEEEEIYDDLTAAISLRRALLQTQKEAGNARAIFVLGPSGAGKTCARRSVMQKFGARILLIEATVAWSDSTNAMLGAILRALGVRDIPLVQSDRLIKVVEKLSDTRRALFIEEAHHLGPKCLNLVKTLINQTPGEFVFFAIDTLWRKLETAAFEEARQLTGNRLAERIDLGREMKARDIGLLIDRRVTLAADAERGKIIDSLLHYAPNYGRFAFVRDTLCRVAEVAGPRAATKQDFIEAIDAEVKSR